MKVNNLILSLTILLKAGFSLPTNQPESNSIQAYSTYLFPLFNSIFGGSSSFQTKEFNPFEQSKVGDVQQQSTTPPSPSKDNPWFSKEPVKVNNKDDKKEESEIIRFQKNTTKTKQDTSNTSKSPQDTKSPENSAIEKEREKEPEHTETISNIPTPVTTSIKTTTTTTSPTPTSTFKAEKAEVSPLQPSDGDNEIWTKWI